MNTVKNWHHYDVKKNTTTTIENLIALLKALNIQFIPYQDGFPSKVSLTINKISYKVDSFTLNNTLKSSKNFLSRIESEIASNNEVSS